MDLNKKGSMFSHNADAKSENFGDDMVHLNHFDNGGKGASRFGSGHSKHVVNLSIAPDDGCRLVLGLGPTPSAYSDDYYGAGSKKNSGRSSSSQVQEFTSHGDSILKLGLSGGTFGMFDCSVLTGTTFKTPHLKKVSADHNGLLIPVVDEGSTSAKKSGGYMPSLLLAPRMDGGTESQPQPSHDLSASTDFSAGSMSDQATFTTSSEHRAGSSKVCRFVGCAKGARGASGLCIGHGGGQRCQREGCNKGGESRTAFCKSHGGGNRCEHLGCTKSAEGKTDYCIAHGGGRRCGYPGGCPKAARGKSGLCIRHGGGKRCKVPDCTRSAEGQAGLCISHGGGRRCQHKDCSKGAQGSTMFCKAHGGGKRCVFAGCTKGAEGSTPLCKGHGGGKRCLYDGGGICPKSVHGGTHFCVAHGGGKRCAVAGCTKSARGRTDCCVKHGGGKRCRFENCGKSAQGSTDFCKAHGGGKRCSWGGEGECEKFARGKSGLCAAHSSMVRENETSKGLIGPGLFHGLVSGVSTAGSSFGNTYSSSGISAVSDCIDSQEKPPKRQHLIPPQVLVPLSMKPSLSCSGFSSAKNQEEGKHESGVAAGTDIDIGIDMETSAGNGGEKGANLVLPEGRVHGGGLMSLFGGNLKKASDGA